MLELELVAKARQEDIQREIERRQLVRTAIRPRPPLRRTASKISRLLIRLGAWLERRMGESSVVVVSPSVRTAK